MNGAQWLARTLREHGVERIFVLCGNGLDPLLDACAEGGPEIVDTRNEQAASYMADAWGRLTRQIGVVAVSAGPGHTNSLTGLANAYWDGGPMLLISGCSSGETRGLGHFQELDQVAMASPVSKYARFVDRVDVLPHEVTTALHAAVSGRPGPVHLTISVDVMSAAVPEAASLPGEARLLQIEPRVGGDPQLIRQAASWLSEAQRPFIVVGSGAYYAQAGEALNAFAERMQIPILSHMWDRGCIQDPWPQYVGVTNGEVNGAYGMLSQADVVMLLGARLDYRLGFGRPPAFAEDVRFVRVDVEPSEIHRGRPADLGIVADPRSALEQLIAGTRELPSPHQSWLSKVRSARQRYLSQWEGRGTEDVCPLYPIRICREIQPFLDRDVTFLLDGGNIGRWAHLMFWSRHPAHWMTCGASGAVGWGVSGAVAAKLSRPSHPLLMLTGDGAAGFTLADIETALRFRTPYVAVVAHDAAWGIVAEHHPEGRRCGTLLGEIRFDRVARALGARGVVIEHPAQLGPAIAQGLDEETVTFIHVPTQRGGIATMAEAWGLV
jgi:acetolactate synthase I/II/III large subunit